MCLSHIHFVVKSIQIKKNYKRFLKFKLQNYSLSSLQFSLHQILIGLAWTHQFPPVIGNCDRTFDWHTVVRSGCLIRIQVPMIRVA